MRDNKGFVIPSVLIISLLIISIGLVTMELALQNFKLARQDQSILGAQLAVDAGIDAAILELNLDNSWSGFSETELFNDGTNRATYEVQVNDVSSDEKILQAIGRIYQPASATTPSSERAFEVKLRGIGSGGTFSIVTGVGGLFMENNSKILGGEVLVNGELSMKNSAQIGLSTNPINVKVAHQNCPAGGGASYPEVCTSGEPISIQNPARIYGDVCATNQTNGNRMSNSGLQAGCTTPPEALPDHDRSAQIAAVASTQTGAEASCNSNGSKIWPANLKIDGDVIIGQQCKVTIEGDVWITGSLSMINQAEIIISDSLGTTQPNIMIDGASAVLENSARIVGNSQDTGAQVLTYWSTASCSPDCADVTGQDLYNSREVVTLVLKNSAEAENSILYARWTQAQLDNGGDIGAIVGQTVKLQNYAAVTFGASVGVGGSATQTWLVEYYIPRL